MSKIFYPAVFLEETSGFSVSFPNLEGCFTEGDTLEDAYANSFEAIGLYFDGEDEKFNFPKASKPKSIALSANEFVVLVEFDVEEYRKRFNSRKIKKTLTLSSWVNYEAEKKKINFSETLENALIEKLAE